MPHAVALVVLVGLWVFGGCDDFQHRYLLRLLDQVKMETGQRRDDAFDLLYAASVPGRATLVRELVALFSTGKEEGEAPSSEKDDTISRYIYDHLKAKESDVVPTLLQQLEALAPKPDQKPGRRLAILSLLLELARDHKLGSEEQSVKNDLNKLLNAGGTDDVEIEYAQRILKTINGGTGTLRRGEGSKPNEPK
jgi:hypothetical protein